MEKTEALLTQDLNSRVAELGRERHNAEQFQKQLNIQNSAHEELVTLFKNTQSALIEELTKEGGVLAGMLKMESSTQDK